jgi:hypothetical protein
MESVFEMVALNSEVSSVRIQSNTQYNTGLFILDLNQAPWGCGPLVRCLEPESY